MKSWGKGLCYRCQLWVWHPGVNHLIHLIKDIGHCSLMYSQTTMWLQVTSWDAHWTPGIELAVLVFVPWWWSRLSVMVLHDCSWYHDLRYLRCFKDDPSGQLMFVLGGLPIVGAFGCWVAPRWTDQRRGFKRTQRTSIGRFCPWDWTG